MSNHDAAAVNEETREAWNANAAFWDERMGDGNSFVNVLCWPAMHALLNIQAGQRVLDIACGNGLTSRRLAALGAQVTSFDFAAEMIALARQRGGEDRIEYRVIDATDEAALLALGEDSYDAALCNMALFDMADVRPLFRTLPHLLKRGGSFVFSIIHPSFNNPHIAKVAEEADIEGNINTTYSIKVYKYKSATTSHGVAMRNQPRAQLYFHRPLEMMLGYGFDNGFVLDELREPAFPPGYPAGSHPLSWGGNFSEFPPVLVARLRRL
jgi:2-polyprenyl-3-methyl-5-hydroxy-6-metoxy-1,4-benzoquinol methylase